MGHDASGGGKVRLDKWLWAARFYKTRSLSAEEIDKGRVRVNGAEVKPAREVRIGDRVVLRMGPVVRTVVVRGLSGVRGSAPVAAMLYEETPESIALRLATAEQRRLAPEPADTIAQGRPSKRNRRDLDALRRSPGDWNHRWSASIDNDD
jgi:ribosome-associated heat shock protein Hsp15